MKNDKKSQLAIDYPYKRILITFIVFGGFVGTFFLSLFMGLGLNPLNSNDSQSEFSLYSLITVTLFMWFFGGFFFGLFPAVATAGVILAREMVIKNFWSYLKLFAIGFFMTMLIYRKIPFIDDWTGRLTGFYFENEMRKLAFNSCGGFSAVICGFFTLPRQDKEI